jgi:cellulose synthase/poly-beta-1,6-N-acetylglucosamine synthase-like glycosyltransferase
MKRANGRPDPVPAISILIPAYHSDDTIGECLEALRHQRYRDFEVIVVNSSAEHRTRRIVRDQFPEATFEQAPVRLLPHGARNRAAGMARGDLLVFTDPDCRARPDWLERLVAAHRDGHPLVCGAIELGARDEGWFARGVHLCKYSFRLSQLPGGYTSVAGTANALCTRQVWEAVGPFDGDRFAGDALFSWRAAARGWRPWFEPSAIVEHRFTGSLLALWQERLARGADFADARAGFENWGRPRAGAYLAAFPLLVGLVLARGARDAVRAGWGVSFVTTLLVQIVGHLAWLLGEARAQVRWLGNGRV